MAPDVWQCHARFPGFRGRWSALCYGMIGGFPYIPNTLCMLHEVMVITEAERSSETVWNFHLDRENLGSERAVT